MALSQVVDVEVNPADVAGVRIQYKLGTAEFSIALSALYQLLLLNPQRGCAILSGLREWERSRRLTDTWAANTPCLVALGELGWEGCSDEDILMSSCGMNPPTPASPRTASPAKPTPAEKPKPPAAAPPKPPQSKKRPPARMSLESGSSSSSDEALSRPHGKGKGKQAQQKRREEPPSLEGDESPDPLLGEQVFVPYTDGVYPGVVTSVVAGEGDKVWVDCPGEKEMFRVERHLLYASHAAAVTHWEQQKAVRAAKAKAKTKKKSNPKPDDDPLAEPAPKPAKQWVYRTSSVLWRWVGTPGGIGTHRTTRTPHLCEGEGARERGTQWEEGQNAEDGGQGKKPVAVSLDWTTW